MMGLTGSGEMTSVSCTSLGTVSIMRANKSAHVDAKSSGESANLYVSQHLTPLYGGKKMPPTHECMVAFPSLPKIRLSEFVVSFKPTTSGFCVEPEIYSVALPVGMGQWYDMVYGPDAHVVVKMYGGGIKMRDGFGVVWIVQLWHNIRERRMLDATKCVPRTSE
jgi:hypothetical protein